MASLQSSSKLVSVSPSSLSFLLTICLAPTKGGFRAAKLKEYGLIKKGEKGEALRDLLLIGSVAAPTQRPECNALFVRPALIKQTHLSLQRGIISRRRSLFNYPIVATLYQVDVVSSLS